MNTKEHATAKDFFKFLGVVIGAIFTVLFFFLRMLGDSSSHSDEDSKDEFDKLASMDIEDIARPENSNSIHNYNK